MVLSPRGVLAIGLGLAGIAYLVAPSRGQAQQQQKADGTVRTAANPNTAPATTPAPAVAPVVGTIDLDFILNNYEKVKASMRELSAAVNVKRGELMKLESEMRQEMEMMQKLQPGSPDYKKREDHLTELKVTMDARKEQAQREFSQRQGEAMIAIYKEIQVMTARVARWRGMNYVVRYSNPNKPQTGTDPNSALAALNDQVIYADPSNDITNDVVYYLNKTYEKTASPAATARPAARRPGAPVDGSKPAVN